MNENLLLVALAAGVWLMVLALSWAIQGNDHFVARLFGSKRQP